MARNNSTDTVESDEITVVIPTLDELVHTNLDEKSKDRFVKQSEQQVVNPMVLAKLAGCRPQMIYNYIRAGKIPTVTENNTQKKVIPFADAQAWLTAYLTKKGEKALRIERELAAAE